MSSLILVNAKEIGGEKAEMIFDISSYSSVGNRNNNEDELLICSKPDNTLVVVADGVGGLRNGEVASKMAVDAVSQWIQGKEFSELELEQAVQYANSLIYSKHDELQGARSTVAALWMKDDAAWAMTVGDTRIYHFRGNNVLYQSLDHSIAQLAVTAGDMDASEIRKTKDRNTLFRALGAGTPQKPAKRKLSLDPGDRLLICTDGFWEQIVESEMIDAAKECETAEKWLQKMRMKAEPNALDNNTAAAILVK